MIKEKDSFFTLATKKESKIGQNAYQKNIAKYTYKNAMKERLETISKNSNQISAIKMLTAKENKISPQILHHLYNSMVRIRRFEQKIASMYSEQEMKCPVHLCVGQEAVAVGICAHLKKDDYVLSNHRGHGHYLAKGGDSKKMIAELYGKVTGCSHGKGGSMHLISPEVGVMGTTSIVGGNIPLGVGVALAIKMRHEKQVAVSFFGDGAVDEGVFHESLNYAALKKAPIIFVCENNFYATCSHQKTRQPLDNIYQRGEIYGIPGIRIDGNNVIEVYLNARSAIERARKGKGPSLLECRTYRWKGHVGPDSDINMDYRNQGELDYWMERCPVKRLETKLLDEDILSSEKIYEINSKIDREILEAFDFAKNSPLPNKHNLLEDLY